MKTLILLLLVTSSSLLAQGNASSIADARRDLFPSGQTPVWTAPAQDALETSPGTGRKSIGLATLYSLLLPGMGELYVGEYGMGNYFTIAEGALWLGLYGVDRHATALQDDARRYAAIHAGTTLQGKDDQYFVDISNFHDVYVYNDQVLRDRDPEKVYDPMGADYWSWDSEANRNTFRDQRVSADKMFNNTRFEVAAIAVNHVVSAINAARLAFSHNRKLDALGSIDVRAGLLGMDGRPDGIVVSVAHRF